MCHITLSIEDKDLLMTLTPAKGMPKADIKKLERAYKSSTYSTYLLIDGALESLLAEINSTSENEDSKESNAVSAVIANAVDATATITLGPENMSATLEIMGGFGGKQFTNADIVGVLKENKVTKGIIKDNLVNIVKQAALLKGGENISTEIALGVGSVKGIDGYINFLVGDPIDRILRPKKLENGNVDMHELGDLVHIKTGRMLAKLIPPTEGLAGFNVIGDVVAATPGESCILAEGEGSSYFSEKKTALIATIDGMPKHLVNTVDVHKVLELENVDVGTGNIRFEGSIYVKGDIGEGMILSATEDIVIGGIIQSCNISCGGNISIAHGIIGRKISADADADGKNSAIIQAKGSISAQFVQYADLFSEEDITVVQYISHSKIIVEGDLWVGKIENDKADGKIFSACIHSGGDIKVGTLGSTAGTLTHVDFNYWANTVKEMRVVADEKTKKTISRLPRIYKLLKSALTQKGVKKTQVDRIITALQQHLRLLGKLNQHWLEKEMMINNHLHDLKLSVYHSILPGVDVTISSKTSDFKRDYEATTIQWVENDISIEPIIL